MVRPGKDRIAPSSADDDETLTQMTAEASRWLNGVNLQLRPDAAEQRQRASQAAAVKRKAEAMSDDERKSRDAERNRRNRARKAAEKAAAG